MTMPASLPQQREAPDANAVVALDGSTLVIRELRIINPETVRLARSELAQRGSEGLAESVRNAITIGMLATSAASAAADSTSTLSATLSGLAAEVEATARRTLTGMEALLSQLDDGQRATAVSAARTLAELPASLERALAGEAGTVRDAVRASVTEVHDRAMAQLESALRVHSETMRSTLSTENPTGPLNQLRRDLSHSLELGRKELTAGLADLQTSLAASRAAERTRAQVSQVKGADWESTVVDTVAASCASTGDLWTATGGTPAPGGTAKTGDVVVRLHGPGVPEGVRRGRGSQGKAIPAFHDAGAGRRIRERQDRASRLGLPDRRP